MASVLVKWIVQSNKLPEHNRKAPEWIQILNEQREPRLNKVLDWVCSRAKMSGKLRLLQLASLHFVGKCPSHSGTPKTLLSASPISFNVAKLYEIMGTVGNHITWFYTFSIHECISLPGFKIKAQTGMSAHPQLFNRRWSSSNQLWNEKPSSTHCYGLWLAGKQEGDVCFHVQWSLDCCVFFWVSECARDCQDTREPILHWNNAFQDWFCACVNGLCSQLNRAKTYRWSILSRIHKQACVQQQVSACRHSATSSWSKFNKLYISSETTECVCELWSWQTGVKEGWGAKQP